MGDRQVEVRIFSFNMNTKGVRGLTAPPHTYTLLDGLDVEYMMFNEGFTKQSEHTPDWGTCDDMIGTL